MKGLKIVLTALILSVLLCVDVRAASFRDTGGHWSESYVERAAAEGVIKGYKDGSFRPEKTISRAEFYALANRLSAQKHRFTVTFKDVRPGAWYYDAVAKAIKAGYLVPRTGNLYPNSAISREEAFYILAYLYDLKAADPLSFKDESVVGNKARRGISALANMGIVSGDKKGYLNPKAPLKRAEVAKVTSLLIEAKGRPKPRYVLDSKIRFGKN